MSLRINDIAPDFSAQTTQGPIRFHDWIGDQWAILFSHPKDFTPVCTTELGRVAALEDEWARRDVKVLAVSVDPIEQHEEWKGSIHSQSHQDSLYLAFAELARKEDPKLYRFCSGCHAPAAVAKFLKDDATRDLLVELGKRYEQAPEFTEYWAEQILRSFADENGVKAGVLINGARVALTGQAVATSLFAVMGALGKERVVKRLSAAEKISV